MIKFLIALIVLGLITICIKLILIKNRKRKRKVKYRKTPKLSSLKGKKFKEYIDDLTSGLH